MNTKIIPFNNPALTDGIDAHGFIPHVTLDRLCVHYGNYCALHDVSGIIFKGSLTAVSGPNGAGKTTLLKTILGIVPPTSGSVEMAAGSMGYLPQISEFDRDFPIRVIDLVAMGRLKPFHFLQNPLKTHRQDILNAMEQAGIAHRQNHLIGEISAGQLKRALFARMILQNADLLCLDEPFAEVDEESRRGLMSIILHLHRQGKTIIMVSHDSALVQNAFPQSIVLDRKLIYWGGTAQAPLPAAMPAHPHSSQMA